MKIKVALSPENCELLNDDGSKIDLSFTSFHVFLDATEIPRVEITAFLPRGSEIEIDNRLITIQEHPDYEDLHPNS
jgi:hypothetical protein